MAHSQAVIKWFLQQNGLSEKEADTFSRLPWVQQMDEMKSAGTLPKNLPPLNEDTVKQFRRDARKEGVPFADFVQQKILPSSVKATPPGPAVDAGTAAAAAAAADIPQPIAPTPTTLGGAPQAPSPLGPLPPGTSIMEPSSGSLQSTSPPGFSGLDQPQIDLAPDAGMAGFTPVTPPGGGGMVPGNYAGFDVTAPWVMDRLQADFGLTRDQAAGIVGNLAHESGGFATYHEMNQPAGRGGVGWPQYTNSGGANRRTDFEQWAAANNADPMGSEPNYQYLKEQLQGPYKRALDAVKDTSTRSEATRAFEKWFEGAKVKNWPERDRYANLAAKMEPQGDAFPTDVELQDAGVTPASWLSGGEYRPLGDGTPAPAPETLPIAPPPTSPPSASDPFAGNVEPPPFTQGPTAAPPAPVLGAPVLGGGVGYDTLPPSADPSMLQRPLEPQLGPLQPPILGAPVLGGAGGNFMPPQGSSDTLGTAYGDPVLGGMGGDLASGDGSLGPLIDPSMPLPTRAPTPPIVGMPMPLQSMMQTPLEPQLPTSPLQIPTRSTYSSNMSPIDQPPMSPFDPAAAPPLGAPSYDMADTFSPATPQYDMANQFSPSAPPLAAPPNPYTMENDFSYDMANKFSPAPTPPATPQYDMANQFSPAMPQFDMANTFTPTPSGGPPGTVPSSTDPNTYVPPGFGVASAAGFNPIAPPSATGNPFLYQPEPPTSPTPTPTQGFDPTQGAPGVGGVPAMPSWAIPGAFGMPGAGPSNIGGLSPMQYAGGTSVPTSMASSTGAYTGLGTNPATLGIPGMTSPMLGMTGPGPQPGITDWSKSGRLTGGIGGGPISEGASPAPAGNAASSASMESHALQLMQAQHAANVANAYQNLAPRMVGAPVPSTISGSSMLGLTGRPSIMQSDLIRPYGMNVGFSPSFGSRF